MLLGAKQRRKGQQSEGEKRGEVNLYAKFPKSVGK